MNVHVWAVVWRTCTAYGVLLTLTKLVGRRQISQLTFVNFVSALSVGAMAAHVAFDIDHPAFQILLAVGIWIAITIGVEVLTTRNAAAGRLLNGDPVVVIQHGRVLEDRLRKSRYSPDALLSLLRQQSIFNVSDVAFAVIEPDGKVSVLKKAGKQPVTPADLSIRVPQAMGMGGTVVADGQVRERNLRLLGLERSWLEGELQRRGVALKEVALAHLDTSGHLYVDLQDDHAVMQMPAPVATEGWMPPPEARP